jgi:hypothetical protein
MTAFPDLEPNSVIYDLGGLNVSAEETQNGAPVLFRHSLRQSNYRITLTYTNLTQTQVGLIRQHYIDSAGSHRTFTVAPALWNGGDVMPADGLYRYGAKPEEVQRGVFTDMTIELATLGAEEAFTSYAMTGTAPFILDGDDADPAIAATLILQAGGAES